jgi:DNA-binding NarL/FixJ family response regulator
MSKPRKKLSSRTDQQRTTKYSYLLGNQLHLVTRPNTATQEGYPSNTLDGNVSAGGRRSTDRVSLDLSLIWESLSPREKDVTFLVCKGFTNDQIALWLKISVSTVKSYLQHVFLKTDVRSKTELRLKFVNFEFPRNTSHG